MVLEVYVQWELKKKEEEEEEEATAPAVGHDENSTGSAVTHIC